MVIACDDHMILIIDVVEATIMIIDSSSIEVAIDSRASWPGQSANDNRIMMVARLNARARSLLSCFFASFFENFLMQLADICNGMFTDSSTS